ncbi:lipoprotein [Alkalihalophilus sp. As8PL]|uniref:Lipoprotein n=1 Tax=Alkalihalophilus sp. As8PL TaxID=3237103 RepID=A0AB39BQK7_9BACI
MKKILVLLTLAFLVVLIGGCGQDTLIIRTPLEGDNYLRNNIKTMDWTTFEALLSDEHSITTEEFHLLKHLVDVHPTTKYVLYPNELFRFSEDEDLLYALTWEEAGSLSKLKSISFP